MSARPHRPLVPTLLVPALLAAATPLAAPTLLAVAGLAIVDCASAADRHPDATRRRGVARGEVSDHIFGTSKVYPKTKRHFSVYRPAAMVRGSLREPAALMVFLDGHAYLNENTTNAPAVLDNLIAAGDLPPTVAVFVDPGFHRKQLIETAGRLPEPRGWNPTPGNRSAEYDTVSDDYGKFLVDELLPAAYEAAGIQPRQISGDPRFRGLCGASSGGICAFKVAWFRPQQFGRVISHIGSFVDINGGHSFPPMIRKEDQRDIRVYLEDGREDLDNRFGNWWLANQQMASALAFREYDHQTEWNDHGHSQVDGARNLPDQLRWLFRDWRSVPKG